jgi:hypothetical protein
MLIPPNGNSSRSAEFTFSEPGMSMRFISLTEINNQDLAHAFMLSVPSELSG